MKKLVFEFDAAVRGTVNGRLDHSLDHRIGNGFVTLSSCFRTKIEEMQSSFHLSMKRTSSPVMSPSYGISNR